MTSIEDLEQRVTELERLFQNHSHEYALAWTSGILTSKPAYNTFCPRCKSLKKPVRKGDKENDVWCCPDCGRQYLREDFGCYFNGVPYLMPDYYKRELKESK